jgi:RecA-family ATPase
MTAAFAIERDEPWSPAQHETAPAMAVKPATFITPADWPEEPPPAVLWVADQRIPRGDVSSLHGDGGAGKTDAALQLAAACARGEGYWFGMSVMAGPVVFLSAEEPEDELRRRIDRHGARDGFDPRNLDLHLWFPSDVAGATLAVPDRSEVMQPTPLFKSIEARIKEIAPVLVVLDNVSAVFAGQQNNRVMVRSFVNLFRTVAHQPSRPAVLLLDHPSLSGITNGTGRGGNMDWRNSVRSGHYLRAPEDKAEADRGVRLLETVKNNYGPLGTPVRLQWSNGGLALEGTQSPLRKLAQDQEADDVFLRLLDERNRIGLPTSPLAGRNYAPSIFEGMEDNGGYRKTVFARTMDRLLKGGKIMVTTDGSASRNKKCLVRADTAFDRPTIAQNAPSIPLRSPVRTPFDRLRSPYDPPALNPPIPPSRSKARLSGLWGPPASARKEESKDLPSPVHRKFHPQHSIPRGLT